MAAGTRFEFDLCRMRHVDAVAAGGVALGGATAARTARCHVALRALRRTLRRLGVGHVELTRVLECIYALSKAGMNRRDGAAAQDKRIA